MLRPTGVGLLVVLGGTVSGCEEPDAPAASIERRDSLGVQVISNPDVPLPFWSVADTPFLDIGTAEGAQGQDLASPWASRRLADGRVLVSDAQSNELRLYEADGTYIGVVGAGGEGPGEFGLAAAIVRAGADTVVVSDARLPRLNLYTSSVEFARTQTLDPVEGRMPRLRGVVGGSLAVYYTTYFESRGGRSRAVRDTMRFMSQHLSGGEWIELGRFPATEKFNQVMPNGSVVGWNRPLGRSLHTAVADGLFWVGISDRYELLGINCETGVVRRIVRLRRAPVTIEETDRSRFFESHMESATTEEFEQMYRAAHEVFTFPATMPLFSDLQSDTRGHLWVEGYRPPWSTELPLWRVFNPRGEAVAAVEMPAGLDVHDIGSDYVLGRWSDELGVEHIRAYRLERDATGTGPS